MKIRSGFVSNSSSSSFIIGIGLIRPGKEQEVAKIFGEDNVKSVIEEVCAERPRWYEPIVQDGGNLLELRAFDYSSVSVHNVYDKMKLLGVDDLKFVVFDEHGDEPEWDDDNGCYNYDWYRDIEAYNEEQQKKFRLLNNDRELFIEAESTVGAGFNG